MNRLAWTPRLDCLHRVRKTVRMSLMFFILVVLYSRVFGTANDELYCHTISTSAMYSIIIFLSTLRESIVREVLTFG
jgi:hypothetical protein